MEVFAFRSLPVLSVALLSAVAPRVAACQHPDNAVANCGFDVALPPWTTVIGYVSHLTFDGSSGPGCASARVLEASNLLASLSQCVSGVTGNASYGFGVDAKLVAQSGPNFGCWVSVTQYASANCAPPSVGSAASLTVALSGAWVQSQSSHVTAPTTQSVRFQLTCMSEFWQFEVRFDDAFYGPGLVPVELSSFTVE